MAIIPDEAFPGAITPRDANYPYGSSQDEVTPGVTGNGTPYNKLRADDIFGFQQALLQAASIVPSGNADTALVSQYLDALYALFYSPSFAGNVDADLLNGQNGAYYRNATNLNAGTVNSSRLPTATTSVKGALESATNSETYAGTANKGVTAASLVGSFNDNSANSDNGYQAFPGGLILQWGYIQGSTSDMLVTWPISFNNSVFVSTIAVSRNEQGAGNQPSTSKQHESYMFGVALNNMWIRGGPDTNAFLHTYNWIAIGW